MDFSLDKEYELKSRLATTEACLHVLEHKMKEASCFHENTLTSMKNEWDRKIKSLQAALLEEEVQKANDLTELEHYEYLMKEALCYHENTLRSLKIDFNQDSAPSRNYNAHIMEIILD